MESVQDARAGGRKQRGGDGENENGEEDVAFLEGRFAGESARVSARVATTSSRAHSASTNQSSPAKLVLSSSHPVTLAGKLGK